MNRNKTAQILNEWKTFLNEGGSKKFKEKDINANVIVKDCCGKCHITHKNVPEKGKLEGKLEGIDMPDRKNANFVLVKIKNQSKAKQFPECCVNLAK